MRERLDSDFYIEIDYEKGIGSPSRVFRAMSDLIDALQETDNNLIRSIDGKLEPILLLEDIQTGSIRAWLRQAINTTDNESLKRDEAAISKYLVKSKYLLISFLEKKVDISSIQEIAQLEADLLNLAEETNVKFLPAYEAVPREDLLKSIDKINTALTPLNDTDEAKFVSDEGATEFNLSLHIAPETIEELVTAEVIESLAPMILKVKKPDFLGTSQWEFRHDNRTIIAKILDEKWLKDFQEGTILIRPGDAIRADVLTQVRYGFDREVVVTHYSIVRVTQVINKDEPFQANLFDRPKRKFNFDIDVGDDDEG